MPSESKIIATFMLLTEYNFSGFYDYNEW